ncbi:MAG: hypothetical protein ACKOKC_07670 [Chthoniobacterales bacterium]
MNGPDPRMPQEQSDLAALWRMVEVCLPAHEDCGAITFLPRGGETLEEDWQEWALTTYAPVLVPALPAMQLLAADASFTALLGEDAALGTALSVPAAQRSLAAGRRALLDFRPPQGAKLLDNLREAAATNASAGHLATVFAVRAHVFHLPSVQATAALLLAECVLGAAAVGLTLPAKRTAELLGAAGSIAIPAAKLVAV